MKRLNQREKVPGRRKPMRVKNCESVEGTVSAARTGFVIWPRRAIPARSASRPLPVPFALMNVLSVTADGQTVSAREMRSIVV